MYWKVGEFLSKETERASYGDAYIDEISRELLQGEQSFSEERRLEQRSHRELVLQSVLQPDMLQVWQLKQRTHR